MLIQRVYLCGNIRCVSRCRRLNSLPTREGSGKFRSWKVLSSRQPETFLLSRAMSSYNRLGSEKSPYLLQHASNPVHWFPWGEEAFEAAKRENKLIFLSVGYSTCHWCHVMERESFENEEIGAIMNEHFISIKVDREERPDVDKVYMSFVHASTGGGGWPMSVFLTPTLKPIFGGTYFPPEDMLFGRPGFKSILLNIAKQWQLKRNEIIESGDKIVQVLNEASAGVTGNNVPNGEEVKHLCFKQFAGVFDPEFGGFSAAPKFPQPVILNFLFHFLATTKDEEMKDKCSKMILTTLDVMAKGGINDHISKGFARYSTDQFWHVPHFEKMLYDQAQLVVAYSKAFQATGDEKYARVTRDIVEYVSRDLRHPKGGFYSGEDADSLPNFEADNKREGAFCVWTYNEIENLLVQDSGNRKDFDVFCAYFNVRPEGNVAPKGDPHGELKGQNVLTMVGADLEKIKTEFGLSNDELNRSIEASKSILFEARQKRPRPQLDDKILTAWNGLMIAGLCAAGTALKEPSYISLAETAASFVKNHLYNEDTKSLLRSAYNNEGSVVQLSKPINGFLDDYAFFIRGLLDLYEADFDPQWLEWALELQEKQNELFWDEEGKGFFTSPAGDPSIVVRMKEDQDGAEPSANSISSLNLLRLASALDRGDFRVKSEQIFSVFSTTLAKFPLALPTMTQGLMLFNETPIQIIITGTLQSSPVAAEMIACIESILLPQKILILADGNQESVLYKNLKILSSIPVTGETKAYVCHNFACLPPVSTKEDLLKVIKSFYK